jgi:2-methylisocitrate lyase-like PEP mutase family enzyme
LFNWAEGGKTPPLPYERLRELGFAIVIFPISTLLTATAAIREALAAIAEARTPIPILERIPSFAEFLDFIGLPEIGELEQRFLS